MRLPQKQIEIHPSTLLAWAIANSEACLSGRNSVHPVYFLLGALRVADDDFDEAAEALRLGTEDIQSVREVIAECRKMLEMSDEQITSARRKLRQCIRQ